MAAAPDAGLPEVAPLMTIEAYRQLPPRTDAIEELHWGELVVLSFPKQGHKLIQDHLQSLLRAKAGSLGAIDIESAFRPISEYDIRSADVAFISRERYKKIRLDDNLHGSPEIVIEILSPSNTKAEMRAKAALCLGTGGEEFWTIDPVAQLVTVYYKGAGIAVYRRDERIPLRLFGSDLEVSEIFEPLQGRE